MKKKKEKIIKVETGKKVKIFTDNEEIEGTILYSYDPKIILLKLSSGYNIGIEKSKIKEIKEINPFSISEKKTKKIIGKIEKTNEKTIEKTNANLKNLKNLPGIAIIVTGGTIASRIDYKSGAVKPLTKPGDIIAVSPKIKEIARITTIEKPFLMLSENMTSKEWKELAKLCEKLLNKKENKGIIILHGTDTLHYTASALSFMLQDLNKPVVLTYAQRSVDRGSSDAMLNLTCSAYAALSDISEVMIVGHATTNDNFCFALSGTKTRKMHTSRRDTFRPINTSPIATIWPNGKIEKHKPYRKRNDNKKIKAQPFFNDKTALIKWYPNASPDIIDFYIKKKYKGLVIESTGLGHVSSEGKNSWFNITKKAIKKGIIVCFAPQCIYGSLDPFVYAPGRKFYDEGVLFLKDILSETAYVKLGFLLGREKDKERVKELMLKNLSGEYNQRLNINEFLI